MVPKAQGRRARKKQATREALEEAAWRLVQKYGYDQTTIEGIADAADVSPRTFFRYFDSKEAALFGDWRSEISLVRAMLLARPAGEPPLVSLRELALLAAARWEADPLTLERKRIALDSGKVLDYELNVIGPTLEQSVAETLAERLGTDCSSDIRPVLYAAVARAALYTAKKWWLRSGSAASLVALIRQAFDEVIEPRR